MVVYLGYIPSFSSLGAGTGAEHGTVLLLKQWSRASCLQILWLKFCFGKAESLSLWAEPPSPWWSAATKGRHDHTLLTSLNFHPDEENTTNIYTPQNIIPALPSPPGSAELHCWKAAVNLWMCNSGCQESFTVPKPRLCPKQFVWHT